MPFAGFTNTPGIGTMTFSVTAPPDMFMQPRKEHVAAAAPPEPPEETINRTVLCIPIVSTQAGY